MNWCKTKLLLNAFLISKNIPNGPKKESRKFYLTKSHTLWQMFYQQFSTKKELKKTGTLFGKNLFYIVIWPLFYFILEQNLRMKKIKAKRTSLLKSWFPRDVRNFVKNIELRDRNGVSSRVKTLEKVKIWSSQFVDILMNKVEIILDENDVQISVFRQNSNLPKELVNLVKNLSVSSVYKLRQREYHKIFSQA